eukprot:scaffold355406_cov33-Prasinocladus_malaysianus.AAC.1
MPVGAVQHRLHRSLWGVPPIPTPASRAPPSSSSLTQSCRTTLMASNYDKAINDDIPGWDG